VRREVRDALLATIGSSTRPLYSRTRGASSLAEAFAPEGWSAAAAAPSSTIFCTAVNNMAMPVALRDVARRVTST
jgi:hypothetical protein